MVNCTIICGLLVTVNLIVAKGTVLTPLKLETSPVHVYKTMNGLENEFEYILKRTGSQNADESPDSKERRSQMGTSFIRFGRSHHQNNLESPIDDSTNLDAVSSRMARGRSDVIIRFGRAQFPSTFDAQRGQLFNIPLDLRSLAFICPKMSTFPQTSQSVRNDISRICSLFASGSPDDEKNY